MNGISKLGWKPTWDSVLSNGTANYPVANFQTGIVYGDYYYIKVRSTREMLVSFSLFLFVHQQASELTDSAFHSLCCHLLASAHNLSFRYRLVPHHNLIWWAFNILSSRLGTILLPMALSTVPTSKPSDHLSPSSLFLIPKLPIGSACVICCLNLGRYTLYSRI